MSDEVDDFLEHVGVKGMKWGVRRGSDGARPIARTISRGPVGKIARANIDASYARKRNKKAKAAAKSISKAAKAKDRLEREDDIQAARDRFKSGQARIDVKNAKAEYKATKATVGKYEAKKALRAVRERNARDYEKSQEFKNGKELATAVALAGAGAILVTMLKG